MSASVMARPVEVRRVSWSSSFRYFGLMGMAWMMDLCGRAGDEDDDLQQVAGAIWADDEPPIGFLAEVITDE